MDGARSPVGSQNGMARSAATTCRTEKGGRKGDQVNEKGLSTEPAGGNVLPRRLLAL